MQRAGAVLRFEVRGQAVRPPASIICQIFHSAGALRAFVCLCMHGTNVAQASAADGVCLLAVPLHVLQRILSSLDAPSLCALAQTCRALLAACSDRALWPAAPAVQAGVAAAVARSLSAALRLPAPLLVQRVTLHPLSRFQAELSLGGLRTLLEQTDAGEATARAAAEEEEAAVDALRRREAATASGSGERPADRWLLGLMASPVASLAAESAAAGRTPCQREPLAAFLAAGCSRARGVLCSRAERAAVRMQLNARFVVVAALQGAAEAASQCADMSDDSLQAEDAVARLAALLLPSPEAGVSGLSEQHVARARGLAHTALHAPPLLRAAASRCAGNVTDWHAVAASALEAHAELALRLDACCAAAEPAPPDRLVQLAKAACDGAACERPPLALAALLAACADALDRGCRALLPQ